MEITVKIDCPALESLALAVASLAALRPSSDSMTPPAPAPKGKKDEESTPTDNPNAISRVEARAALNDLRSAKGTKALRAVLDQMGVKSFTDLKSPEELARAVQLAGEAMA